MTLADDDSDTRALGGGVLFHGSEPTPVAAGEGKPFGPKA
jgi:hypothetical protein